jgi:hypothetical protein
VVRVFPADALAIGLSAGVANAAPRFPISRADLRRPTDRKVKASMHREVAVERLLTTVECGQQVGLSVVSIWRSIQAGELKAVLCGNRYGVKPQDLSQFAEKRAAAKKAGQYMPQPRGSTGAAGVDGPGGRSP